MDQLFDAGARFCNGQILQKGAQLHDKRDLTGGEIFPNEHRGDQSDGHQHIGLDVKGGYKPDEGFQKDGDAAKDNRNPGGVKGEGKQMENADD